MERSTGFELHVKEPKKKTTTAMTFWYQKTL
jgi:hypothetical protein